MGPVGGIQGRETDLGRRYDGYTVKLAPFIKPISLYHRPYQLLGKSDNFYFLAIEGHGAGHLGPRGGVAQLLVIAIMQILKVTIIVNRYQSKPAWGYLFLGLAICCWTVI